MGWWSGASGAKVGDGPADFITDLLKNIKGKFTLEEFLSALEKSIEVYSSRLEGSFPMVNFRAIDDKNLEYLPERHKSNQELSKNISYVLEYILTEISDLFKEQPTLNDIFENFNFVISDISEYFNNEKTKHIYFKTDNN